jgi:hypothetical protein
VSEHCPHCLGENKFVVHCYPTDKYGAAATVSTVITVAAPEVEDSGAFVGDVLNGSLKVRAARSHHSGGARARRERAARGRGADLPARPQLMMDKGNLEAAGGVLDGVLGVLNVENADVVEGNKEAIRECRRMRRRRLAEGEEGEELAGEVRAAPPVLSRGCDRDALHPRGADRPARRARATPRATPRRTARRCATRCSTCLPRSPAAARRSDPRPPALPRAPPALR